MRGTFKGMRKGGLVVAVAVGLAGVAVPAEAKPVRPAVAGDVNGDGRVDVIAGLPLLKVKGKSDAGGVVVYFGGAKQVSTQGRVVTLAAPVARENLGRVLASGDFDADGYADVLASARKKLVVFRGSPTGLRGADAKVLSWPVTEPAMAAADFDGDGYGDVAVTGSERIVVLRGGRSGLRVAGGLANGAPRFGADLAAGDVNGDGRPDLVATEHRVALPDPVGPQRITVVPGSRAGLSLTRAWSITPTERAARDLAVADVNGDHRADLVRITSTEGENFRVLVQLSQGNGFAPARTVATGDDYYPANVALGDITGDGRADLAVHISAEGDHDWALLYAGTATGVGAQPIRRYAHDTYETRYGTSLRLADVRGDRRADVIAGLPGVYGAGALEVLPSGAPGGAQRLGLKTPGGLGLSQPS
ncbi:VCBS repeat-containing protein [Sphaerisporangium album]|uniref:VCBS repeat-containing protein n=1 Tax=Sphaerisporangium album TaxID=509200 RepID=A0A367F2C4_9ACTN|nr:VCBS repeat-containing protein [Sphaerisporangium album]RCG24473.1 VCBS repeat-containing protein [Sphaerisporangium album]